MQVKLEETVSGGFSVTADVQKTSSNPETLGAIYALTGEYSNGENIWKFSGTVEFFEGGDFNAELIHSDSTPVAESDAEELVVSIFQECDNNGGM